LAVGRAPRKRCDVQENPPARDLGNGNANIIAGTDYEYDEAHDMPAGSQGGTRAPRHVVSPPEMTIGEGADYGYDEAHDFGS
jgi:hypothetical protein